MTAPEVRGEYVDRFYEMDPQFEDLCFGTDLREGMVVLIADLSMRGDGNRQSDPYERARVRTCNRWATVTRLSVNPRREYDPLVRFVAEYADGTKAVREYAAAHAWLFKKASVES